jgi:RHS repeat-associated protein
MMRRRGISLRVRRMRVRWHRILVSSVVVTLLAQLLPAGLPIPGMGVVAAFASDPVAPPSAVNPAPRVNVVTTPGPTVVSSSITTDTVWGPVGSPYVLHSSIAIATGASLTLLPGTVVKLDTGAGIGIVGQLLSLGTPGRHVVITSLRDDTVLGDTNGDGSATSPAPGDWSGLSFSGGGTSWPTSVLDYADVRYGGSGSACTAYAEIHVWYYGTDHSMPLIVSNSSITDSANAAFVIDSNAPVGVYNNHVGRSCMDMYALGGMDVVGNTFDVNSDGTGSIWLNGAHKIRFWFNTVHSQISVSKSSSPPTRPDVDVRFNSFDTINNWCCGQDLADWTDNWYGHDANVPPTQCMDLNTANAWQPPINLGYGCTPGGWYFSSYKGNVLPALSGPPPTVVGAAVAGWQAPRFGPVNTFTGALTYEVQDLAIQDAGKAVAAARTYHSDRSGSGDAGAGWSTTFSDTVSTVGAVSTLTSADGDQLPFTTDAAAGYVPSPGVTGTFATGVSGSTFATPDRTSYNFDASGAMTGMDLGDPGHHIDVHRAGGVLDKVTGVSGRFLSYARSGGLLQTVTDSTGRSVTLAYTGGRLTSVTGVDGHTETYGYDAAGHLTSVTTPSGLTKLAAGYDGSGRVVWLDQAGTGRTTFAYDPATRQTTVTLPDGTTTVQEYDALGRVLTERTGSTGRHVVYDGEGRPVAVIDGVPAVEMTGYGPTAISTFFNGAGDPVWTSDPMGGHTSTTFDVGHHPLVSTRADGTTITRSYDTSGRMTGVVDPAGKTWTYTYNSFGEVTTQTDPLGRTRTLGYAGNGDLTSVTDETGAVTGFGYDGAGRRTTTTDPDGNITTTGYTAWDVPNQTTSPRGGVTSIGFDIDRRQVSSTNALGAVTSYGYDTQGRLATVTDPASGHTTVEFDALGRPVKVTDARGSIYRRSYTAEGSIATTTDPDGNVTATAHDPSGRAIRVTDATGAITQTVYDRNGHTVEIDTPDGATRRWAYNVMGQLVTYTLPRGGAQTTTYDANGRVTSVKGPRALTNYPYTIFGTTATYDAVGRPATSTDEVGTVTTYTYNDTSRTATATDPAGTVGVVTRDAAGNITSRTVGVGSTTGYGYDPDGQLSSVTDPTSRVTHYTYDLADQPLSTIDPAGRTTSVIYDVLGRPTTVTYPAGDTDGYTYDPAGNITDHADRTGHHATYNYDPAGRMLTATDPLGHTTTYTYDPDGRQTSATDPTGVVTNTAYDPVGRPAVTWDITGASWVTGYDLDGNIASETDPAGVGRTYRYDNADQLTTVDFIGGAIQSYSFSYDNAGRLTTGSDPYTHTYTYDGRGNLATVKDNLNNTTSYGYDGTGRRTSTALPSGHTSTVAYDAAGRVITAVDGAGDTSHYTYDTAGQLATVTLPRGGVYRFTYDPDGYLASRTDPLTHVTSFNHDGLGHLTSQTFPSGRVITAVFDAAGQMTSQTSSTKTNTFGYDNAGRLTSTTSSTATLAYTYNNRGLLATGSDALGVTSYGYDNAQRLNLRTPPAGTATAITYTNFGEPDIISGPSTFNLDYDTKGNLSHISSAYNESFTYDNAGRPTGAGATTATYNTDSQIASQTVSLAGNTDTTTYTYDNANRVTTAGLTHNGGTATTTTYGWNADSNRTSVAVTGQPTITSTYNLADQITGSSNGLTYSYNLNGELTSGPTAASTYVYNPFGKLKTATTPTATINYTFDGFGRTATRTTGTTTQTFSYDGTSTNLATQQTGTTTTNLIRDPHQRLLGESTVGGSTVVAGTTIHGDLNFLATNTGVTWTASYDPFGATTATTGTAPVALGFQTMPADATTGWVDMGARQYNPAAGEFTTADTITGDLAAVPSLNRYLYGDADPINHFDPDGHWSLSQTWNDITNSIAAGWNDLTSSVSHTYHQVSNAIRGMSPTIKATAASFVVGGLVFLGCEAATAGIGSIGCAALSGAAGGAVYGAMMCPEHDSTAHCAVTGAVAGALAGAAGGIAGAVGYGGFGVGAITGAVGDATDQMLTTGHIDPGRTITAAIVGGALGAAPALIAGVRNGTFTRAFEEMRANPDRGSIQISSGDSTSAGTGRRTVVTVAEENRTVQSYPNMKALNAAHGDPTGNTVLGHIVEQSQMGAPPFEGSGFTAEQIYSTDNVVRISNEMNQEMNYRFSAPRPDQLWGGGQRGYFRMNGVSWDEQYQFGKQMMQDMFDDGWS